MSMMNARDARDPRTRLVKSKYFSLHPKPLERWLWQQGVPQSAERVFWLHWEAGMRVGDWCSEIPIAQVARECCVDPSTVTRAYQVLKRLGLLRRQDPGRNPDNPFQQATAITEVRLPRELLAELSRSPDRPSAGASIAAASVSSMTPKSDSPPARTTGGPPRPTRQETQAMWARASAAERARFFTASRDRTTTLDFDVGTGLTAEDRREILAQLAQHAVAVPEACVSRVAAPAISLPPNPPQRLSVLELARVRRHVLAGTPAAATAELLRQIVWSVEEGALRRFAPALAINIALKKIREGTWSRPHRLPPNWLPSQAQLAAPHPSTARLHKE